MSAVPQPFVTPQEYLARERQTETKHEYHRGEVFAMGGATPRHNLLVGNIVTALNRRLENQDCLVFPSDLRVKVNPTGLYTYPDVSVLCGEAEYDDEQKDTLLNPIVLIEVLSPSTADYDRGGKFAMYRQLPSLQEYILISQDAVLVEHYVRDGQRWILSELRSQQDTLPLPSLDCELPLAEVYHKVEM